MSGSVEDFFLIRREININTILREDSLHEVRKLIEGGLVHFLQLFLPLKEKKRKANGGVVDFSERVEVLGVEKMRRGDSVVLGEDGENLITFRRPEESGLLVRERSEIRELGKVGTTEEIIV